MRGKGRGLRLPLPDAVGEAIVAYLRDGRPAGVETRAVFVTVLPPARAMGRGAISQDGRTIPGRAGLGHVNAHRLRHTLASEMLTGGADLPAIGQVLGHRMMETTAIYAKCDRDTLRRISRPWPGSTIVSTARGTRSSSTWLFAARLGSSSRDVELPAAPFVRYLDQRGSSGSRSTPRSRGRSCLEGLTRCTIGGLPRSAMFAPTCVSLTRRSRSRVLSSCATGRHDAVRFSTPTRRSLR